MPGATSSCNRIGLTLRALASRRPAARASPRSVAMAMAMVAATLPAAWATCTGTVYLTIDTGHMEPASEIADILAKHQVKATFFLANEKTRTGGHSLDDAQQAFWQRLAREGHAFGSHTWDHHYFRGDVGADRVSYIPWGKTAREGRTLDAAGVCAELRKSELRFQAMTGRGFDGIWRAPGGKTTPRVIAYAEACGFRHVGWTDAGFLGDELPSERHSNQALLKQSLARIGDGDILLAHLGIWSRKEPYWPTLDPLLAGLKAKGLCFATLGAGTGGAPAARTPKPSRP